MDKSEQAENNIHNIIAHKATNKRNDELEPLLPKGTALPPTHDCFGFLDWLSKLEAVFGRPLLILLFVIQHCNKGFGSSFVGRATPYMYKSYNTPAPQVQIYSGITQLPWALKPIIGLVSDMFPVLGYNKAPYVVLVSAIAGAAFLTVGTVSTANFAIGSFVLCLFVISLQASTCDLLSEAKYAERMQENPSHGPAMMTYVWAGLNIGGLLGTILSGVVLESMGPQSLYLIGAVPSCLVIVPVALGYFEEKKQTSEQVAASRNRYFQQKEACGLCILMLLGTFVLIFTTLHSTDPLINCIVAAIIACVMLISFSIVLNPVIAKANAFALIQTALGFSTGGASFYFYTDTPEQYPEGPHFSDFFYNSVLGVVGAAVSLFGIFCYQRYMTNWKYRSLLITTNLALGFFSIFDIMMFARINVKYGIPDHLLVLGLSVFEGIIFQWQWMPQVVIMSYLCPKGMEATMYALLAGCHNMGNTIASNCGALLLERLGCKPSGSPNETAQFDNLWKASAVSAVLPFFAVCLLINLMPDARQDERLVKDDISDATEGSLLRRWLGHN
eukprot:TRINITY_DN9328_c0_g1_i1.p1 TRINITY_DN9328_c0_g1~~TRINITY_DN9328_c0_g1_i1.p1  ORF type:complete len:586 (+),score=88.95 TRINITY_DN9328_c0_g1_i1:87-1760(+)